METAEKLITENLDVWTSAVKAKSSAGSGSSKKRELYGIQKLRELILDLAVRGMLVSQDPVDEPADKLLKRVEALRDSLIQSKKIKNATVRANPKFTSAIELPASWQSTTLGMIADWGSGSTPKRDNPNYYGGPVTWLKSGELNDCQNLSGSSETISQEAVDSGSFRMNKIGDVLIAMYGATIGKVAILAEPAVTNQAVCGCTPFEGVFNRYVFLYLLSQRASFHAASEGGAQPNISKVKLLGYPFPLPPLAEQHRIVAKVDELMALCDQLEQEQESSLKTHDTLVATLLGALTTATADAGQFTEAWQRIQANFDTLFTNESSIDQLKQTILQLAVMGKLVEQDPEDETVRATQKSDLFGSDSEANAPFEIPPIWRWSNLDQLASINGGFAFKSSDYSNEGTRVVRISDFDEHGFKDAKIVRHSFSPELEKFSLRDGDILMAMTGGTVGKSLHARALTEPMLVNQRVATIRASEAITSNYLNILIQSELTQKVIHEAKNSTNDNISMRDIKGFLVPLPPLAEQHRIVAKVDELMALCDQLKASLATAQTTQLNLADSLVDAAIN